MPDSRVVLFAILLKAIQLSKKLLDLCPYQKPMDTYRTLAKKGVYGILLNVSINPNVY